jgi:hypothetical protein
MCDWRCVNGNISESHHQGSPGREGGTATAHEKKYQRNQIFGSKSPVYLNEESEQGGENSIPSIQNIERRQQ